MNKTLVKWEEKTLEQLGDILDSQRKPITKRDRIAGEYPYYGATGLQDMVAGYIFDEPLVLIGEDGAKWGAGDKTAYSISGKCWVNNHAHVFRPNRTYLLDNYLINYLNYIDLKPFITGATVEKLNQEKLRSIPIPVPPLSEQQRIVGILDEAFENIEKAKQNALQNLNNAKELFESYLINTFLNNNETWLADTLQNICEKISAGGDKPEIFSETKTIECNIPIYSNGIKDNGLYGYTNNPTIEKPAITISARGTIGFICKRLEPYCPIVRLISLIPRDFIDLSFLAYAMNFVIPKNTGTSIPQLTVPNLKNNIVKYPPLAEQQKIVAQLDELQEQTKKLEQIYEQKIKDLDELKQSILQKAFNGEL